MNYKYQYLALRAAAGCRLDWWLSHWPLTPCFQPIGLKTQRTVISAETMKWTIAAPVPSGYHSSSMWNPDVTFDISLLSQVQDYFLSCMTLYTSVLFLAIKNNLRSASSSSWISFWVWMSLILIECSGGVCLSLQRASTTLLLRACAKCGKAASVLCFAAGCLISARECEWRSFLLCCFSYDQQPSSLSFSWIWLKKGQHHKVPISTYTNCRGPFLPLMNRSWLAVITSTFRHAAQYRSHSPQPSVIQYIVFK